MFYVTKRPPSVGKAIRDLEKMVAVFKATERVPLRKGRVARKGETFEGLPRYSEMMLFRRVKDWEWYPIDFKKLRFCGYRVSRGGR